MHLRTTILFKDIGKFTAKDGSNLYGDSYSGNHIAIFECPMKSPPQLSYVDHSPKMYLDAYKINLAPTKWKIVDIDNFMRGNSYFTKFIDGEVWDNQVRDLLGADASHTPIYKEEEFKNNPRYVMDVLKPDIEAKLSQRDYMDTRSNILMNPLAKKRAEML